MERNNHAITVHSIFDACLKLTGSMQQIGRLTLVCPETSNSTKIIMVCGLQFVNVDQ